MFSFIFLKTWFTSTKSNEKETFFKKICAILKILFIMLLFYVIANFMEKKSSNPSFDFSKSPAETIDESGDKNHGNKQIKSFSMLLNLARLLNVPEEEMLSEIALQAASKCQGQAAIDICRFILVCLFWFLELVFLSSFLEVCLFW